MIYTLVFIVQLNISIYLQVLYWFMYMWSLYGHGPEGYVHMITLVPMLFA